MSNPALHLLFVYGSLKRGFANHALLAEARFEARVGTAAQYRLGQLGAYPTLFAAGDRCIVGELYGVTDADLVRLDAFEGAEYERRYVRLEDGRIAHAYFVADAAVPSAVPLETAEWGFSR